MDQLRRRLSVSLVLGADHLEGAIWADVHVGEFRAVDVSGDDGLVDVVVELHLEGSWAELMQLSLVVANVVEDVHTIVLLGDLDFLDSSLAMTIGPGHGAGVSSNDVGIGSPLWSSGDFMRGGELGLGTDQTGEKKEGDKFHLKTWIN